jgi:predicted nucleic acid-binding Zn ribbon protein
MDLAPCEWNSFYSGLANGGSVIQTNRHQQNRYKMKSIKTVLNTYLFKTGLDVGVNQQQAANLWPTAVGKKIAENTTVQDVKHGVLIVRVDSPIWAQELQFQKKEVLFKINKTLGKKTIKDIRFV